MQRARARRAALYEEIREGARRYGDDFVAVPMSLKRARSESLPSNSAGGVDPGAVARQRQRGAATDAVASDDVA